ncbi:hypothetical protein P154DRAFT_559421 [Amniculicola lignicola CBS 123094]|uniref:Uncharacterized protein n=1 Tax=Amniculicola lignicola CBS 123094 TaxID=1392246 RepID=A0A6A5WX08_9PLEO|nr:hypothetical protein P154DRAFT_559421 [Amniculicola lignicola CBS 123094]
MQLKTFTHFLLLGGLQLVSAGTYTPPPLHTSLSSGVASSTAKSTIGWSYASSIIAKPTTLKSSPTVPTGLPTTGNGKRTSSKPASNKTTSSILSSAKSMITPPAYVPPYRLRARHGGYTCTNETWGGSNRTEFLNGTAPGTVLLTVTRFSSLNSTSPVHYTLPASTAITKPTSMNNTSRIDFTLLPVTRTSKGLSSTSSIPRSTSSKNVTKTTLSTGSTSGYLSLLTSASKIVNVTSSSEAIPTYLQL